MPANKPIFRNPDKVQVLPFREWMRDNLPTGAGGMVIEDLDLVPLLFGPMINRLYTDDGRFSLVELKNLGYGLSYGQKRLFGLIDTLLRFADPTARYYSGFFCVGWNYKLNQPMLINDTFCTEEEFRLWMQGKIEYEPYDFSRDRDVGRFVIPLQDMLKARRP